MRAVWYLVPRQARPSLRPDGIVEISRPPVLSRLSMILLRRRCNAPALWRRLRSELAQRSQILRRTAAAPDFWTAG
jgi:hypothetical protein